jgi:hypothetical protein
MKSKLIPLLLLAGCAAPAPKVIQAWESPAAEFPAICMLQQADGTLAFRGGFQFYHPGTWRQDADRLTLTLGPERQQFSYKLPPSADSFNLSGFYFYRTPTCGTK